MRLLLVEDDVALRDGLQQALSVQGFAVNSVGTGQQARAAGYNRFFDRQMQRAQ